jgi:proteasome regulatory subunit
MNMAEDVNLRNVATISEEASGADLSAVVMEAGMFAIRNNRDIVESSDFNAAVAKVLGERNKNLSQESGVMFA